MDFMTGLPISTEGHQLQLNPGYRLSADEDGYMPFELNCGYHPHVSYEATLPAIISIRDIFHVSLLEQDTARKGRVYENAAMYENATRTLLLRTRTLRKGRCYSAVYENATRTLCSSILRPATMRSTRWKVFGTARFSQRSQKPATYRRSTSPVQLQLQPFHRYWVGSGGGEEKLPGLRCLDFDVQTEAQRVMRD